VVVSRACALSLRNSAVLCRELVEGHFMLMSLIPGPGIRVWRRSRRGQGQALRWPAASLDPSSGPRFKAWPGQGGERCRGFAGIGFGG
jgi:hypothetical protein